MTEQTGEMKVRNCRVCGLKPDSYIANSKFNDETITHVGCYGLYQLLYDEWNFGSHGTFLSHLLEAWKHADRENKGMMTPLMEEMVKKYNWPSTAVKGAMVQIREGRMI